MKSDAQLISEYQKAKAETGEQNLNESFMRVLGRPLMWVLLVALAFTLAASYLIWRYSLEDFMQYSQSTKLTDELASSGFMSSFDPSTRVHAWVERPRLRRPFSGDSRTIAFSSKGGAVEFNAENNRPLNYIVRQFMGEWVVLTDGSELAEPYSPELVALIQNEITMAQAELAKTSAVNSTWQ